MSFGIIIRGKNQPSSSKRFKPHYNQAMGKMIHTKEEYLGEMKRQNLVPYNKSDYKDKKEKSYKPSEWAHGMTQHIRDTKGKVSGKFYSELEKKGVTKDKIQSLKSKAEKASRKGKNGFS